MILEIILTSVSVGLITTAWKMPNFKPFNCPACLSCWVALGLLLWQEPTMWWVFPAPYLLMSLFLTYESK